MNNSKIEWTQKTWNPIVGCSKVSPGCQNCYAIKDAHRLAGNPNPKINSVYQGLTEKRGNRIEWTGEVKFLPDRLDIPLKTRKPTMWFVNSMSDCFHESVTDEQLDQIFAVMALCPQHVFQVLTKRPDRMVEYLGKSLRPYARMTELGRSLTSIDSDWKCPFPLPNVWLGVTCENQKAADDRIPLLLQTLAAVRFLSCEPLLEDINLAPSFVNIRFQQHKNTKECRLITLYEKQVLSENDILANYGQTSPKHRKPIDWVIVGGESGRNARPCDEDWIRSIVQQCKEANVPVFVKQLGGCPVTSYESASHPPGRSPEAIRIQVPISLKSRKGGNIDEFPEDLRVREFPQFN